MCSDEKLTPYQLELTQSEAAALLTFCNSFTPQELLEKGGSEEESLNIVRVVGSLKWMVAKKKYSE